MIIIIDSFFFFLYFIIIGIYYLNFTIRNIHFKIASIIIGVISCSIIDIFSNISIWSSLPISFICLGIALYIFFDIKLKVLVLYEISTYCVISLLNQLIRIILYLFTATNIKNNTTLSLIRDFTILIIIFIVYKLKKQTHEKPAKLSLPYIAFLVTVVSIDTLVILLIGYYFFSQTFTFRPSRILILYCLVIAGIAIQIFLLIYMINSRNQYHENEKLAKYHLENQLKYYEYLEQKNYETRKFRHDMRSHLYMLQHLCEEDRTNEYKAYLNDITANFEHISTSVSVNHGIADAVLNKYYYEAQNHNITLHVDGHFPPQCNLSAYDVCTIFSNLLDNAMDAVIASNGSDIHFSCRYTDREIILVFENDFKNIEFDSHGNPRTHKKDSTRHGFGLKNVEDCVNKNHGYMNIDTSDNHFRIILSLNRRNNNDEDCSRG